MSAPARRSKDGPEGLRIVVSEQRTTRTLAFEGEWDLAARDATYDAIARALMRCPDCLVLDLSRVDFIDMSAVHALIYAHERCAVKRTRLAIVPGPPTVQRVLEICGLTGTMTFRERDELVDES